jgi:hypothetical protein
VGLAPPKIRSKRRWGKPHPTCCRTCSSKLIRPIASVSLPSAGVWRHDGITISAIAKRARPRARRPSGARTIVRRTSCVLRQWHELGRSRGRQPVCKAMRSIAPMLLAQCDKCPPVRRAAASRRIPDLSVPSFCSAIPFGRPHRRNGQAPGPRASVQIFGHPGSARLMDIRSKTMKPVCSDAARRYLEKMEASSFKCEVNKAEVR